MADVEITIRVPGELVERARSAGVELESRSNLIIGLIEDQIERQEAARNLLDIADKLTALPDEFKPTSEEIERARREFWESHDKA